MGRETIYNQAVEEMTAHNDRYEAGEETYFQGVNQFTDMTLEEFQALPMFGFVKPEGAGPNLGTLTSMSEQQFVDCSKANSGCNGGLMDYGFQYAAASPAT